MSLKITNRLSAKQKSILEQLGYVGNWQLTIEEAEQLITELFAVKTQDDNYTYEHMPAELKWLDNEKGEI